jgi:hypothetical protein
MRSTLEIEGTWEEILANAKDFSGKRVRLTLLEQRTSKESDLRSSSPISIALEIES